MKALPDVQNSTDGFPKLKIDFVGVENIRTYLPIQLQGHGVTSVLATFSVFCSLNQKTKGINMSRIGDTIFQHVFSKKNGDGFQDLSVFAEKLMEANECENILVKAKFPYILDELTPYTELYSNKPVDLEYECAIKDGIKKNHITLITTETSLCPCSKEMSLLTNNLSPQELNLLLELPNPLHNKIIKAGYGAHNQTSDIIVRCEIKGEQQFDIDMFMQIIRESASVPTYSILKRPDEKMVTEIAYLGGYWENGEFVEVGGGPKFVEDIVRGISDRLNQIKGKIVENYEVQVKNNESIHCNDIVASAIITTY